MQRVDARGVNVLCPYPDGRLKRYWSRKMMVMSSAHTRLQIVRFTYVDKWIKGDGKNELP
jgi:hypothetical protein